MNSSRKGAPLELSLGEKCTARFIKLNERIGISVGHVVENDRNAINVGQRLDVVHGQVCKRYSQKNLQNRFKAKQI